MKKLIYIPVILVAMLFASCDDFLETENESGSTDETVYSSVYFTQTAVNGLYDRIADAQMYAQRVSLNWSTNNDIEFAGADENSYNQNSNRGVSNYYATPGNNVVLFSNIFTMIERANLVIAGINNSPLIEGGTKDQQNSMKALLGEALTLRALGYFELVRLWGDIPFKVEPTKSDLSNVYIPKTDRDSIMNYLLKDLEIAEEYVPWIGQTGGTIAYSSAEKVSKGFVKGLYARICLARAGYSLRDKAGYPTERGDNWEYYYGEAKKRCEEIILQEVYTLKKPYVNIWKDVNAYKVDGVNGENLYEVALGLGRSGEIGYSIGVRFYANTKYGYSNNSNVVNTSAYYFYSFDQKDPRRDVTVATAMYSNGSAELKEVYQSNPLSYNIGKWDQRWMAENSTWLNQNLEANGKWGYGINWIVMRYSDIYLMLAEIDNELNNGPTEAAKNALKKVRERAFTILNDDKQLEVIDYTTNVEDYVNNLTTRNAFFDAIVHERAWEFGGEAVRKFDLIRWNLLMEKIQDQRDAFIAMMNGQTATVFDKTYDALPENIYYWYLSDKENLAKDSINYYAADPDLDALTSDELKALNITKVKWMFGFTDDNKSKYTERINKFSSGLWKSANGLGNGVCDNRHLYPIQTSVISDYLGVVTNSYGY